MGAPRCVLVGCGPMGIATADSLAEEVCGGRLRLLLVDRDPDRAAHARERYAGWGGSVEAVHGTGEQEQVRRTIDRADVVATALTWSDAEPIISYALGRGVPVTGIGQPPRDPRELLGAPARGCRALLPVGLEPGLTEILAAELVARLGGCTGMSVLCGGVPQEPRPPLGHSSWFGTRLTIGQRTSHAVRGGRITEVERFTGTELVQVPGVGVLEASHDALQTWPADGPLLSGVAAMTQKTLRWPGFAEKVRLLADVGLLQEDPVRAGGVQVAPRDVLDALLAPRVTPGAQDRDVTVLAAEGVGHGPQPDRRSLLVLARGGGGAAASGMALLTGGVLAESVRVLLRPDLSLPRGVLRAPEVFTGPLLQDLLGRLRRRGAAITESRGPAVQRIASGTAGAGPHRRPPAAPDHGPDGR